VPGLKDHRSARFDLTASGDSGVIMSIPSGTYGTTPTAMLATVESGDAVYTSPGPYPLWKLKVAPNASSYSKSSGNRPVFKSQTVDQSFFLVPFQNLASQSGVLQPFGTGIGPTTASLVINNHDESPGNGTSVVAQLVWNDVRGNVLRTDSSGTVAPGGSSTLTVTPPTTAASVNVQQVGQADGVGGLNTCAYTYSMSGSAAGYTYILPIEKYQQPSQQGFASVFRFVGGMTDSGIVTPTFDSGADLIVNLPLAPDSGWGHVWGCAALAVVEPGLTLNGSVPNPSTFAIMDASPAFWNRTATPGSAIGNKIQFGSMGSTGVVGTADAGTPLYQQDIPIADATFTMDARSIDPAMQYAVGVIAGWSGSFPGRRSLDVLVRSSEIANIRCQSLWNGSSNNAPPAGWYTRAYSDSGWGNPATRNAFASGGTNENAGLDIWSSDPIQATGEQVMFRHHFDLPEDDHGADTGSFDSGTATCATNFQSNYISPQMSYVQAPTGSSSLDWTFQKLTGTGAFILQRCQIMASPTNTSQTGAVAVASIPDPSPGSEPSGVVTGRYTIPPAEDGWYYSLVTTNFNTIPGPGSSNITAEVTINWHDGDFSKIIYDSLAMALPSTGGKIIQAYVNEVLIVGTGATAIGPPLTGPRSGAAIQCYATNNVLAIIAEATHATTPVNWLNYAWAIFPSYYPLWVTTWAGDSNWADLEFIDDQYPASGGFVVTAAKEGVEMGHGYISLALWTRPSSITYSVSYHVEQIPKAVGWPMMLPLQNSYFNANPALGGDDFAMIL
jgi:hypothetical protein